MGEIADKFGIAFRDNTTQGVPASGPHEPIKREIRAIAITLEAKIAAAALAGGDLEAAEALIAPLAASAAAAQAAAENAADSAQEISDAFPGQLEEAVSDVLEAVADQPVFAAFIADALDRRLQAEARATLYGISDQGAIRLFGAEATEVAFAESYYRIGYDTVSDLASLPGVEIANGPLQIDGRGLLVTGEVAVAKGEPATGDVTFVIEVDVPAFDGGSRDLAYYVGNVIESRVGVFRSNTGVYALQVYNPATGLQTVGDFEDLTARRIRVAVTVGATQTRASFDGRAPVVINIARPPSLLRLWFGRTALGQGSPLNGRVLRAAIYHYPVTDDQLRAMSGGRVTVDAVSALIDQKIQVHDQDLEAHELSALRLKSDLAESKTGIWTVASADDFNAADGVFTTAPVGGQAWAGNGGPLFSRISGQARTPDGNLRGNTLNAGVSNGQVECDLIPGSVEASLYIRFQSNANYLLLQRQPDTFIGLSRFLGGVQTLIAPAKFRPVAAGERYKVRFVGPRIWVFRVLSGVEELLFDVTEPNFTAATSHGIRLNGTGAADNFRVLKREAL